MSDIIFVENLRSELHREVGIILAEVEINNALCNLDELKVVPEKFNLHSILECLANYHKLAKAYEAIGVLKGKLEMIDIIAEKYKLFLNE